MTDIVRRRIPENLIPENVIIRSAKVSGGVIFQFIENLKACCIKALRAGMPSVNNNMLNEVIEDLTTRKYYGMEQKYVSKLNELYDDDKLKIVFEVSKDEVLKELLFQQSILEYRDDENKPYYGIHPVLAENKWWVKGKIP
jgi:hypothetical protein